jgi:hypothetical protein
MLTRRQTRLNPLVEQKGACCAMCYRPRGRDSNRTSHVQSARPHLGRILASSVAAVTRGSKVFLVAARMLESAQGKAGQISRSILGRRDLR